MMTEQERREAFYEGIKSHVKDLEEDANGRERMLQARHVMNLWEMHRLRPSDPAALGLVMAAYDEWYQMRYFPKGYQMRHFPK